LLPVPTDYPVVGGLAAYVKLLLVQFDPKIVVQRVV
jgi:hypothetical protein